MTSLHPQRVRDDRVLPETRWAALIVFFILLPATAILWVAPDRTGDLWAWMIQPELTTIFLGSGYGAGAYFFWRTYRTERWHPSSPGVLGAAVFAGLMLIATGIHWDRFGDFEEDNPLTWLHLGGLLGTAGALALLHARMETPGALRNTVGPIDPRRL